jgi:ADP-ribose pyrophosphatase
MQHDGGWTRRSSRYLYESRWYNLRQDEVALPDGTPIIYTLVEHPGYAMIVPVLDDRRVIMERIYRYPLQATTLECPSGGLDGQPPEQAARRELEEETGWVANKLTPLGSFFGSSGMSDERFHLFLAEELSQTGQIAREPTEQMELELLRLEDVVQQALRGQIADAPSALALILAHAELTRRSPIISPDPDVTG